MEINKYVTVLKISKDEHILIDYMYYNNLLHILSIENESINLIIYDINKYQIIKKYYYYHLIYAFFDNDKIYALSNDSNIHCIDLNDFLSFKYKSLSFYSHYFKQCKNYIMYKIHDNFYLCHDNGPCIRILDCNNNKTYKSFVNTKYYDKNYYYNDKGYNRDIYNRYYQIDEYIYINCYYYTYKFDTKNKKFESIENNIKFKSINYIKISKSCCIIENNLYDYKNGTITKLFEPTEELSCGDFILTDLYSIHESNKIVDNLYCVNGFILIETNGTKSLNDLNDKYIILTNGIEKTKISINVLKHRTQFFKNMFNDLQNLSDNIEIKFDKYDKLDIYIKYITTNIVNNDELYDLLEICLFLEDCDIEHIANHTLNMLYGYDNIIKYLKIFYIYNLKKQYYCLLSNNFNWGLNCKKFIDDLKKDNINSDFYIDTLEYICCFHV